MARYSTTLSSTLTPTEAFSYLVAFEHVAEWDPGVARARALSATPPQLGSEFEVVTLFRGREIPLIYRIVEFDAGSRFVLEAQNQFVFSRDEVIVTPGETTSVTYNALLRAKGLFTPFAPILALQFRQIGDRAREGLRRAVNP